MKGKQLSKNNQYKILLSFPKLEKYIHDSFNKKYMINELVYGSVVINNIIYNEKTHIVALFKDYLISDDLTEFLKRFYTSIESSIRLPKFYEYYETYSRIYPNYTSLGESKYIYKNIHKKQKMIDLQQKIEESEEKKKEIKKRNKHKRNKEKNEIVFSTDIYNSIVNDSEDLYKLFGIKKNKNSEKSIDGFNKIIKEIDKCELETPNSVFHSFGLELFISKGKNSINNNNKIKNMAGKLFSACTKQMNTISKEENISGNYRNYKSVLSDLQLLNSNSINHKKTISSSSGNNSLNKNHNKTQIKKYYYYNNNNNQSYNNILPYSYKNRKKGEMNDLINKIKVNINTNNLSIKKGYETDRVKNSNNINVIKNNNFNYNRKHNCILNSKGILISNNINKTHYPKYKKKKSNQKNLNLNLKDIFSPKITKKNEGIKKENHNLKTNDFNLLRKSSNNNTNTSLSNSKVKTIINNTNHLITTSTINTSSYISNPKKTITNKNNNYKNFFSTEQKDNKINVNILNESKPKNKNNKKESQGQKRIIQGIQIKNFSKALRLSQVISPKYGSNRIEIQNKTKIITPVHFSKPKTERSILKKKL